jgi:cytochrome c-type biogenesis protein CcmF
MTRMLGEAALLAAVLSGCVGVVSGVLGWRSERAGWTRAARLALLLQPVVLTGAVAALLVALVGSDMGNAYVAHHTERSLPVVFKVAALWAGQEGSLLLWAWLLSVVGAAAAWRRRGPDPAESVRLAVLAGVGVFFVGLLVWAAPPFAPTPRGPLLDGWGLNPMLQHWAMVVHAPLLLAGYACASVPFAGAIGALAAGGHDGAWAGRARRWALGSWVLLTGGILLGAWWAYVELGWGGYWAWDPVENASLLPWLAATGLLHTIFIVDERGRCRGWAAGLACLAFLLCVLGTTLTRSGLLVSVHAFGQTTVGIYLAGLVVGLGALSVGLLIWRREALWSPDGPEPVLSREGLVVVLDGLLVAMIGAILLGTLFPIVGDMVLEYPVSVGPAYYNRVVVPLGLAAAAVMALGPVALHGSAASGSVRRGVGVPGAVTAGGLVVAGALGVRHPVMLLCIAIAMMAVLITVVAFVSAVRAGAGRGGVVRAGLRVVDRNHRRYGGQLVHVGLVLVVLGVCGSGLFAERTEVTLDAGQSVEASGFTIRFDSLAEVRGENYNAIEAVLEVTTRRGTTAWLGPQRRFYDKSMDPATEVAIRSRLGEDLYVTLAGWEAGGGWASFAVHVNPLVAWIWVGGAAMICGGIFCLLPRLCRGANNETGETGCPDPGRNGPAARPRPAADDQKDEAAHVYHGV